MMNRKIVRDVEDVIALVDGVIRRKSIGKDIEDKVHQPGHRAWKPRINSYSNFKKMVLQR